MKLEAGDWPPKGYEVVPGKCPNAGHACNCIGECRPTLRKIAACPNGQGESCETDDEKWAREYGGSIPPRKASDLCWRCAEEVGEDEA